MITVNVSVVGLSTVRENEYTLETNYPALSYSDS